MNKKIYIDASDNSAIPPDMQNETNSNKLQLLTFEDALVIAGRDANEERKHNPFAEYHATCQPNTLHRHYYDLRCLCQFLAAERMCNVLPRNSLSRQKHGVA